MCEARHGFHLLSFFFIFRSATEITAELHREFIGHLEQGAWIRGGSKRVKNDYRKILYVF